MYHPHGVPVHGVMYCLMSSMPPAAGVMSYHFLQKIWGIALSLWWKWRHRITTTKDTLEEMAHLSTYYAFQQRKKRDGQKVVVKDTIYMHAIRLQQTRVDLQSIAATTTPAPFAAPLINTVQWARDQSQSIRGGAPSTTFNFLKLHVAIMAYTT